MSNDLKEPFNKGLEYFRECRKTITEQAQAGENGLAYITMMAFASGYLSAEIDELKRKQENQSGGEEGSE